MQEKPNPGGSGLSRVKTPRPMLRILALLALAAAIAIVFITVPVKQYLVVVLEWARSLGVWGPIVVAAAYALACVLFIPGSILTLGAGFMFGLVQGGLAVWIGSNLGAASSFILGRTIGRDWIAAKVSGNARFNAIDEAVGNQGFKIVFLTRLSPVFPFSMLNYGFGLTRVSFRDYALASLPGMLPGTMMYVYLGSAARSLAEVAAGRVARGGPEQAFFWFGLAATVVVTVTVTRIARKALREAVPEREEAAYRTGGP